MWIFYIFITFFYCDFFELFAGYSLHLELICQLNRFDLKQKKQTNCIYTLNLLTQNLFQFIKL